MDRIRRLQSLEPPTWCVGSVEVRRAKAGTTKRASAFGPRVTKGLLALTARTWQNCRLDYSEAVGLWRFMFA